MMYRIRIPRIALILGLVLGTALAAPATGFAQGFGSPGRGGFRPLINPNNTPAAPSNPPPVALPGAQARASTPAPSDRMALDMSPNDALFDAINRGDSAGVRDAVARGADLQAHNILGMTPVELSVDLGRNDITFLLLSLRGSFGNSATVRSATAAPPPPGAAKAKPAANAASGKTRKVPAVPPPVATASAPAPQPPRQFAGSDGGTPQPQAGFLGFGGSAQP